MMTLAFHGDGAAHLIDDALRDGHAQPGSLDAARLIGALSLEGLEDTPHELGRHAYTVVLDLEPVQRATARSFSAAGRFGKVGAAALAQHQGLVGTGSPIGRHATWALQPHAQANLAARLGVFHGIADKVQQHLTQAQGIAAHVDAGNVVRFHVEHELLRARLLLGDNVDQGHELFQTERFVIQHEPPAFDLAHLQNIVDQAYQVVR